LLVVIGIVAILISVLSPTLAGVRRQGDAIKCSSNLRQIMLGWVMYANTHKGTSVPGRMRNLNAANNVYGIGNGDA